MLIKRKNQIPLNHFSNYRFHYSVSREKLYKDSMAIFLVGFSDNIKRIFILEVIDFDKTFVQAIIMKMSETKSSVNLRLHITQSYVNSGSRIQNKSDLYIKFKCLFKSYKNFCTDYILIEVRVGDMQASMFLSVAIKLH